MILGRKPSSPKAPPPPHEQVVSTEKGKKFIRRKEEKIKWNKIKLISRIFLRYVPQKGVWRKSLLNI